MESFGIDEESSSSIRPTQDLAPQLSPKESTFEPRKYMSKSHRACDFCRFRKSACRSTEGGLSCRLCSSHGRQCTFVSGSVRIANRKTRRGEKQQRAAEGNAGIAKPDTVLEPTHSHSIDEGVIDEEPRPVQERHESQLSFGGSPEDWTAVLDPGDQLTAELGLLPLEMVVPTNDPLNFNDFPGAQAESSSEDQSPFDIQPLLEHEFFDIPILFPEECPIDNAPDHVITQVMGPTGDQNPHMIKYHRFDEQNLFVYNRISYRTVADSENSIQFEYTRVESSSFPIKMEQIPSPQTLLHEKTKLESMIPQAAGDKFIQLYFKFVNAHFPILSSTEIPSPSDSPPHLLAAIYLVAEQFAPFDEFLCLHVMYKPTPPKELFDMAWRLISTSLHRPTISLIQAGLVLLLKTPLDRFFLDRPFKWSLMGTVITMAQTLGLHLDPEEWRIPYQEIQLRKRLSWIIFAMDKWFALSFGCPANLNEDNWSVVRIHTRTGPNPSSESEENFQVLQASRLTSILSSVLQQIFSNRSMKRLHYNYRERLKTSRSLLLELSTWHSALPGFNYSARHSSNDHDASTDYSASLELGYHTIQLAVFRALLKGFGADASTSQERETPEWKEAYDQCRAAGKTAILAAHHFLTSLSTVHFEAFWPPWTSTGFAMICSTCIALVLTSRTQEEAAEYKALLDKIRGTLRIQSKSFEMMRFALLKMDAIFFVGFERVFTSDLENGAPP